MQYRARNTAAVSAWIRDCRGAYTHGGETVCAGFHLYRGFVGCPAWRDGQPCSYPCFLKTTFRTDPELRKGVAWVSGEICRSGECGLQERCDMSDLLETDLCRLSGAWTAVKTWLQTRIDPYLRTHVTGRTKSLGVAVSRRTMVLNAGELADSFGFPPEENPHVGMLLDLFSSPDTNPHGHKLLLVTKGSAGEAWMHLQRRQASENVIVSWSVGNLDMDPYWVAPISRAAVAAPYADQGWRVRLRLDPLDSEDNCNAALSPYQHARNIAELQPDPELITLGTLRHRGGRVKLPAEERASIYRSAIEGLRAGGYEGPIGLCKETKGMIQEVLSIEPEKMGCNCGP